MSKEALKAYQDARNEQLQRNEARHIRTRVHEARQAPHIAAMRWPFELLQNSLDAGPRTGRSAVTVRLSAEAGRTVFEHDGAPFSSEELAALLSGGSSKEFGSDETTGRFGTGFLVTHVLAEQTLLDGLLEVSTGFERFRLALDRSGDEQAILANIELCNEAIRRAETVANIDDLPSARFEYPSDDDSTLAMGVTAFRSALPYLYGTRPELGDVHLVDRSGAAETWIAERPVTVEVAEGQFEDRHIHVRGERTATDYRVLRFAGRPPTAAAALVLLHMTEDGWEVVVPNRLDPRIYCQYPLRSSSFLPVAFVLDGRVEPDQERSRALMNESDRLVLSEALAAAVIATEYACGEGWRNAHLLAAASRPVSGFDADDGDETAWWLATLQAFAESVARLPIIETSHGRLPAITAAGAFADFVSPRLLNASSSDETTVPRMWPLVDDATALYPPISAMAEDWSRMAEGWTALGLDLNRITAETLAGYVRAGAVEIADLRVQGDPDRWLVRYLDVVGECWRRRSGVELSVLEGLLPNQKGRLCSPAELRRDGGVAEELKDICDAVGFDVRSGLLSDRVLSAGADLSLEDVRAAVETAVPAIAAGADISSELLEYLRSVLPEDAERSAANEHIQQGTARLLGYLWETDGESAASVGRKVPLTSRSGKVVYWSADRRMMAPVAAWNEAARPFIDAYPADRILDDIYMPVVVALEAWEIAHADPLTTSSPPVLDGPRLAEMVLGDFDSDGVTVRGEQFSHIALLPREVINHIQDVEHARALLGLVLCHAARHDPAWRVRRSVPGSRARESIDVPVRGALWVADLRSRAWIPVRGEDERLAKVAASVSTLRPLLDPTWLEGNDDAIALLTECFGFDELDLRLLGIPREAQERVRQGLARLLESGGGDPAFYEALAQEVEARRNRARDVERCRRIGYAVQDAVRLALERHGLSVILVDHGFDYAVSLPMPDETLDDFGVRFALGTFLVEVKATSVGPARLTPTQAETAGEHAARYVLCVVDLRGLSDQQLDGDWTGADVEQLASIVNDIGAHVLDTCVLVRRARESDIGIRNESALRYEVPPQVWERGVSISDWVATIASDPEIRAHLDEAAAD